MSGQTESNRAFKQGLMLRSRIWSRDNCIQCRFANQTRRWLSLHHSCYNEWKPFSQNFPIALIPVAQCVLDSKWEVATEIFAMFYFDGLVQNYSSSIANALEILPSCIKPSICYFHGRWQCWRSPGCCSSSTSTWCWERYKTRCASTALSLAASSGLTPALFSPEQPVFHYQRTSGRCHCDILQRIPKSNPIYDWKRSYFV